MKYLIRMMLMIAMAFVAWPAIAADGVLIVEKTTSGATASTNQVQIEKTRLRAEASLPSGRKQVVVFDGARQVLWVINEEDKSYTEMTKADMDRMGGQMSDAMARMQEQMKNMPPEQRAQVEAMMRGRGMAPGGGAAATTEYRKTGADKVGKWSCTKYEGYRSGQKVVEVCTVDPKDLGFTTADFDVTRQLADFFRTLMPQNADQMFTLGNGSQGFAGIPVRRVSFGQPQTTTELTDVSRQAFPDSLFSVPAGFRKQAVGAFGPPPRP